MGWKEDLENFALNALTFGGWGIGQAIGHGLGGGSHGPSAGGGGVQLGGGLLHPPRPISPLPSSPLGGVGTTEAALEKILMAIVAQNAAKTNCCERFKLADGYLVDGSTGAVWRLNTRDNTLEEVPKRASGPMQGVVRAMTDLQLSTIAARYAEEALTAHSPTDRAAQLKAFDETYLEPIRVAMNGETPAQSERKRRSKGGGRS